MKVIDIYAEITSEEHLFCLGILYTVYQQQKHSDRPETQRPQAHRKGFRKMNEKTMRQIEAIKQGTIGVEVEMNGITRRAAAKIAAEFFGTGRWEDSSDRNGYHAFSAFDQQGREWKFQYDSSIDGPDSQKCEVVTPILHYDDIDTLQELCRRLRKAGGRSDASRHCGVHVHIGADGHTPQSLRALANMMASHEQLLFDALKVDSYRQSRYCKPVDPRFLKELNKKKPKTMDELADVWYSSMGQNYRRNFHYNQTRYHALNYHATFTKGTIEWRLYEFRTPTEDKQNGIHSGLLKTFIQLSLALSARAKEVKSASAKPIQTDNPKFQMRTWLNSLGMIGPEFETARRFLTENLEGDAAFRFGREARRAA